MVHSQKIYFLRRATYKRLVAGEKVRSLSKELGVSQDTLYPWKRQILIDAGRAEGVKNLEADVLAQAYKTIAASRPISKSPGPRWLASTARSPFSQKAVPGCRSAEQPCGYTERVTCRIAGMNSERMGVSMTSALGRSSSPMVREVIHASRSWRANGGSCSCSDPPDHVSPE